MRIILKREYPGIIKEKDENGVIIYAHPTTLWVDYYEKVDDSGVKKADKVKQEFWVYHDKIGEEIDNTLARPKELEADGYKDGSVEWCRDNGFSSFVDYWCTEEFKAKRKRGQHARLNSEDVAQNRGGSRPFIET